MTNTQTTATPGGGVAGGVGDSTVSAGGVPPVTGAEATAADQGRPESEFSARVRVLNAQAGRR